MPLTSPSGTKYLTGGVLVLLVGAAGAVGLWAGRPQDVPPPDQSPPPPRTPVFQPRGSIDPTGYNLVTSRVAPWPPDASLEQIAAAWRGAASKVLTPVDETLANPDLPVEQRVPALLTKAGLLHYDGEAVKASAVLEEARTASVRSQTVEEEWLYTIIYLQGLTALRQGETENCVMCRGESSCILPLAPSARHTNQTGSRQAIKHFSEYLERFPDDLPVKWLLNVAHMTLGEYPERVDPRFRLSLDQYTRNDHGIGRFRDVGHLVGTNRLNMAGAAILDDFHGRGLLDVVFTSLDPTQPMAVYRNKGDGTFEDRTKEAGLLDQLGGLGCVQGDYNNDGFLDVFIMRGAWLKTPMRPTLLRNNGDGTFADVTEKAGLIHPMNTDTAQWADFDNDGHLDLFVCGEAQPSRLYRNKGDGTFEEVAAKAGLGELPGMWKGCSWFDYDADRFPDLYLNNHTGKPRLFRNNRNGTFTDVTDASGITGPRVGLSCWTWDYDNDGWPDLFATSYDRTLGDVIRGVLGQPHGREMSRLYRNLGGKKFADVTKEVGLDACFSAMGTNFGDFDNDGFLDFYLGTGDHDIATLVPNRMFRNLGGKRFADISSSSGTGHLQKGHGVGIGDWDRNGTADLVIQMGGAIPGDKYHNILFQNPGQGNNWLNVKLVGKKTNRAAIGARIKAVTAGDNPLTVYRTVCSGSSFGANPLEQLVGLGKADRVAVLEVYWPTSDTTQTFRDVRAGQAIEITELATEFRVREYKPVTVPK
jgi:FG-GAP-like repeat/ASPIC and UnbV